MYANDDNLLYENVNVIKETRENLLRACKGLVYKEKQRKMYFYISSLECKIQSEYNDSRLNLRRYVKVQVCRNDTKGLKSHSR